MVRIALWALRIYLLILLSLIGMKFTRMFTQSRSEEKPTPLAPAESPEPSP
jgi:hypothetical protein